MKRSRIWQGASAIVDWLIWCAGYRALNDELEALRDETLANFAKIQLLSKCAEDAEETVLSFRRLFDQVNDDNQQLREENRHLKLQLNGIPDAMPRANDASA